MRDLEKAWRDHRRNRNHLIGILSLCWFLILVLWYTDGFISTLPPLVVIGLATAASVFITYSHRNILKGWKS
jgi:hypothetical protein